MTIAEYIVFLKEQAECYEKTCQVIRNVLHNPLDPNLRLQQGYHGCLIRVIKDLESLSGLVTDEAFFPDLLGFLEEEDA